MGGGEADSSAAAAAEVGNESSGGDAVAVNIRSSNGAKFSVQIGIHSTVESFKAIIAQNCDVPANQQRLIYKGRILKDDQTLQSYGLEADHTVHLVRSFAPTSNPAGGTSPTVPNTTQNNARPVGSAETGALGGSGLGASPFAGLGFGGLGGNSGGLFGAGLPEFEEMQQLTQNPNMMREIMNMPAVQNLMNNPEIVRNLIMNNPQMREIMDRNPELAHVLNDPSILRQTLETARNPELMREMMRNTDRAMSNIEASPEGFNMLRRMYENVQEPLLNATTMGGSTGSDSSNPFAALMGVQGRNQATDGTTNSSTTTDTATNPPVPNANPLPNPWSPATTGGAQTNTTRSNSGGDAAARPQAPAGLGGLGITGLEGMMGSMPDMNSLNQMMQNPAVTQMMQSLLSNPQYLNQVLGLNPQLRSMLDSNPQLREMMQNPEFLRQLTSPGVMQQMMTLQQSLMPQLGRQQSTQDPAQTGGGTGAANNMGLGMLMNMLGGLGSGTPAIPRSDVPPEQLYATQLTQLQEMGFFDTQENIRALTATGGNVHAAVERLLGSN